MSRWVLLKRRVGAVTSQRVLKVLFYVNISQCFFVVENITANAVSVAIGDNGNRLIFEIWWIFFYDLFSIKNYSRYMYWNLKKCYSHYSRYMYWNLRNCYSFYSSYMYWNLANCYSHFSIYRYSRYRYWNLTKYYSHFSRYRYWNLTNCYSFLFWVQALESSKLLFSLF